MIIHKRKCNVPFFLTFLYVLFVQPIEAAELVSSQGELCFKIVSREDDSQVDKLLRIEVVQSDTAHIILSGILLDKTETQPQRYWVSGNAHSLTGNFESGTDAWFSGALSGIGDIADDNSQTRQIAVTFSLPVPLDTLRSEWLDSTDNSVSLMSNGDCTDNEFSQLLLKNLDDFDDGPGVIIIFK